MSKRLETSQAYIAAEERLINVFAPLNNEAASNQQNNDVLVQKGHSEEKSPQQQCDPAVDSVLHIISDNSDIHSLVSLDEDEVCKGFYKLPSDKPDADVTAACDVAGRLVFGLCRRRQVSAYSEFAEPCNLNMSSAGFMDCTPTKQFCSSAEIVEIDDSPDTTENTGTEPHGATLSFLEAVGSHPSSFVINTSNACNFDELGTMMTNGNASSNSEIEIIEPSNDIEQDVVAEQSEEAVPECIIYESPLDHNESNVIVLTDENGCEVYVSAHELNTERQMAHTFLLRHASGADTLLGILPQQARHQRHQMQLNGEGYITEVAEDQPNADAHNVYLSDSALEQQDHQLYAVENDEQLEEERADDCPVFDDELQELHDECVEDMHEDGVSNNSYEPEMQQIERDPRTLIFEQQQLAQTAIVIADDLESLEDIKGLKQMPPDRELVTEAEAQPQLQQTLSECENSGTTEFPVSSTSMPNGTEYDDYDDDLPDEQQSAVGSVLPPPRKHPPLLKNMLVDPAEVLDRKLANICHTQPPMSLIEKINNWNCFAVCDPVEDVENFELTFEQHETCSMDRSFEKFHESLNMDLKNVANNIYEKREEHENPSTLESEVADQKAARFLQRRKNVLQASNELPKSLQTSQRYKRLLNAAQNVEANATSDAPHQEDGMPIVLTDDDDDDDDCVELPMSKHELQNTASTSTLTPVEELLREHAIMKTIHTQTSVEKIPPSTAYAVVPMVTKETSTTDLECPAAQKPNCHAVEPNVMSDQIQIRKLDGKPEYADANTGPSAMADQDETMYEQHEFCNYLGLTELATANAVATALRELANNAISRRTLRVRSQQQLDRMRSNVRGNRRERQREATTSSELSTHATTSKDEEVAAIAADNSLSQPSLSLPPPPPASHSIHERETNMSRPSVEPQQQQQQHSHDSLHDRIQDISEECNSDVIRDAQNALHAAFARTYAAAAPTQSQLYESIQEQLKQSRKVPPSIFIIKSLSNVETQTALAPISETTTKPQSSLKATMSEKMLIPRPTQRVTLHEPIKQITSESPKGRKVARKLKRRRTTTAAVSASNGGAMQKSRKAPRQHQLQYQTRDLVTRSTTHNNSKLLRNRKVNLLKSYELADVTMIRKKRLSGGSTAGSKPAQTPQVVKATLQKSAANAKSAAEQRQNVTHGARDAVGVTEQETKTQRKTKHSMSTARAARAVPYGVSKHDVIATKLTKRNRTKSLPTPLSKLNLTNKKTSNILQCPPPPTPSMERLTDKLKDNLRNALHTDDFITNQAVVRPPINPAARQLVLNVRKMKQVPSQESGSPFSKPFTKPALVQTHTPAANANTTRVPDLSGCRQMAGSAGNINMEHKLPNVALMPPGGLMRLTNSTHTLGNPLTMKHGKVLYMYYELDQLIVLQEKIVTFWKYSKVFNVLHTQTDIHEDMTPQRRTFNALSTESEGSCDADVQQWIHLGRARRLTNDMEIATPFSNRMCAHNSTPVYVEMRSKLTDHNKRECTLLSLYVNVYYYCEEELRPKMHSVHLDSVTCNDFSFVIYTTITESRYFVMAWQQEMVMGKPRSGMCKYSLTPNLDTLASIREFKQLRHDLNYIECLSDDRLIGYGRTHITIWDHRSGDTLMNYDLGFNLGRNLGAIYYPSFDMDQSNMLILYQHIKADNKPAELQIIACEISHASPSHRVLHVHTLPSPQFDENLTAINTGDHLIVKSRNEHEIWISSVDPRLLTYVAPQGTQCFYTRYKSQIIELAPNSLTVDSIANHMLKLATKNQQQMQL